MVPQQGAQDLVWVSLGAPCTATCVLPPVMAHGQELPLRGTGLTEVICTGAKAGVEWRSGRKMPGMAVVVRGEGREAAVPSRSSAGAIHGLQRPLLAPGSRRKAARLGEKP